MEAHARRPPSLIRRLQLSVTLATLLAVALLGAVADAALERAFEREDTRVMRAQAEQLARQALSGRGVHDDAGARAGQAEWRVLDHRQLVWATSVGWQTVPALAWPAPAPTPQEVEADDGSRWSLLTAPVQGPHGAFVLQLALDQSFERDLVAQYRLALWLVAAAIALALAWASRLLALQALRSLRTLADATARVRPGTASVRLDPTGYPSELHGLVLEFNAAQDRLDGSFQRLQDLGSDLAHELRTPVQNLRALVEHLVLRDPSPAERHDTLGSALEELDRLAAMIDQMLFLARSDDPGAAIARESIDIAAELRRVADVFEAVAEDRGVRLDCGAGTVTACADRGMLRRALHNLAANAVRHAPPGSTVLMRAEREGAGVSFAVVDAGPGMPPEVLGRLGDRFVRADRSRDRSTGGAGLGLAIVAGIARLHGGRLEARAGPGGVGCEVRLWLPDAPLSEN